MRILPQYTAKVRLRNAANVFPSLFFEGELMNKKVIRYDRRRENTS